MQTEQNNSQKEIQNKKSFKLKVKEWFTKKPNFLIRILIPTIIFVELLHYLLKEIIFLEAWAILTIFIISYITIIVLFIAKKRDNFFVKHFILTFFLGVFLYNYVTYPSYTYRYRMTVEVETPEGLKTGSSVVELHTEQWNSWLAGLSNGNRTSTDIRGEGVMVKIDNNNTLLVTLVKGSSVDHAINIFNDTFFIDSRSSYRKANWYHGTLRYARGIVTKKNFPSMFNIVESDDQKSVEIEELKIDNLETSFVNGVSFKGIFIETTNDLVTSGKLNNFPIWSAINNYLVYYQSRFLPYNKEVLIKGQLKYKL